MNTNEVFHLWANQSRNSAKSGNVFFEGATLYSYGHHFPIATLKTLESGERVALFNPESNSRTTNKHVTLARRAVHGCTVHRVRTTAWEHINGTASLAEALRIQTGLDAASAESAKQAKREAARAARERKKLEAMDLVERAAKWRAGEVQSLPYNAPVHLRIVKDGTRIETSRGAVVPVAAAVRAWPLIKAGQADPGFSWGNYTGLSIRGAAVIIGCHEIPMAEIERMAAELKIA